MLNREEIFEICLEDYTQPRYKSAIRTYYGTEAEIHDLMDRLANSNTGAAVRYNETMEAFLCCGITGHGKYVCHVGIQYSRRHLHRAEARRGGFCGGQYRHATRNDKLFACRSNRSRRFGSDLDRPRKEGPQNGK